MSNKTKFTKGDWSIEYGNLVVIGSVRFEFENEQQQVNQAIEKGINKLVNFAIEFRPENGNRFSIDFKPNNGYSFCYVWNGKGEACRMQIVHFALSIKEIDDFNFNVEHLISEIKREYG